MGDCDAGTLVLAESLVKYHPSNARGLTSQEGHRLVGSLTGVVASKSVTEAFKGTLGPFGKRPYGV